MKESLLTFFTPADQERLRQAVEEAESKTSGEIVPYVVERSDTYDDAEWRGGALLGILAVGTFALLHSLTEVWVPLDVGLLLLVILLAFVAGMVLVKFASPVKRFFAGSESLDRRVAQRAAEAFIAEEIFDTRDRTGILIFVSLLEHRVLVLGDAGINARVKPSEWEGIVHTVVQGIRAGTPAEGLIEAIRMCGEFLARRGVAPRPDDSDELPDALRLEPR